ncbi:hypothetical protein [Mesorhizobium sp. M0767]|uniref:hypothetical protein n=1 Tax=Mesorhizobium sp. M0767 TaxID=2956995 RepID=UPI003337C345
MIGAPESEEPTMPADKEACLRFDGTSLQPCEAPEWYAAIMRDADENGGDTKDVYRRHGVLLHHQFGEVLDSVHVYEAGPNGHLVEYWNLERCLATILIDNVAAYLEFRAKYLHAWAWLIAEVERIADADYETAKEGRKRA